MSGGLLPNAEQTFLDVNGDPLSGGQIFTYVPGTTDPKMTWTDIDLTVPNTNPIILDQAGRATIWSSNSAYRQVALDQFGNRAWDRVTQAFPTTLDSGLTINGDLSVSGTINAPTGNISNLTTNVMTVTQTINVPVTSHSVLGSVTVQDLTANGNSTFQHLAATGIDCGYVNTNFLDVSATSTLHGTVTMSAPYSFDAAGDGIVRGILYVGLSGVPGALEVLGDCQFAGNGVIDGIWTVNGTLILNGVPLIQPIASPLDELTDAEDGTYVVVKAGGEVKVRKVEVNINGYLHVTGEDYIG